MSRYLRNLRIHMVLISCLMLCGCGYTTAYEPAPEEGVVSIATLGMIPDFSYEYTEQTPHIITDRVGYAPTGKKVAYIKGEDLSKDYTIITSTGAEVVYQGKLKKVTPDGSEESLYLGDFSDFNKHGSFRIYQQDVGYSYIFNIDDVSYNSIYNEAYNTIIKAEYSDTEALIYTLGNLMATADIYPDAYSNEGFIKGGIELLLTQQHPRTGAVYGSLQDADTIALIEDELGRPKEATIDTEKLSSDNATIVFAGILAQYYSAHLEDEPELSVNALRAATKAYAHIESHPGSVDPVRKYYADTELYRATGGYKYKNAIALYDTSGENVTADPNGYNYSFLGDLAYLSTGYRTDYARCEQLMANYRDIAGSISISADRQHYYVQQDIEGMNGNEVLDNMMILGLVGYVLSGREYSGIEANYLHYIFGLNDGMVNYYNEPMGQDTIPLADDPVRLSKLVFILGSGTR